jgi:predicted metal-dependent hydrolase
LGYFEDSEMALNSGEEIADEQDNIHGKSYIYRGYKNLYTSWGKYDKAKIYIVKALKAQMKLSHPTFETF